MPRPPETFDDLEAALRQTSRQGRVITTPFAGDSLAVSTTIKTIMDKAMVEATLAVNAIEIKRLNGEVKINLVAVPDVTWIQDPKGQEIFQRLTRMLDVAAERSR